MPGSPAPGDMTTDVLDALAAALPFSANELHAMISAQFAEVIGGGAREDAELTTALPPATNCACIHDGVNATTANVATFAQHDALAPMVSTSHELQATNDDSSVRTMHSYRERWVDEDTSVEMNVRGAIAMDIEDE